jgi:3'-phosphoadenosine 5'-phosphosulfate sulfotransferase/3'-phosphoadenosine 5'-phosphosulfate sulfotransferase (PAPS reductase)/FAD synthetase
MFTCEMSFYLRRGCHPASVGEGRCSVYRVVVRAKKDADAVRAMLSRYYGGWDVEVVTLGGVREPEKAAERLAELADGSNYVIVLLGRDDTPLAELAARAPPTAVFKQLKYAKVRNSRLMALHAELEKARAALRNCVGWTGSAYVLSPRAVPLFDAWDPAYDVFIGLGEGFRARLEELVGPVGENPLLVRMRAGLHEVYSGPSLAARLRFPDEGLPSGQRVGSEPVDVELGELVKANEAVIKAHERVVLRFLQGRGTGADEVFVPLSGGKDSSAALALAVKAFGAKRVTAVYVDTGVDFPQNPEYVRGLAAKLGVKLEVARAPVLEELPSRGLPTHGAGRWCTGLKLEALRSALRRLAQTASEPVVVVGDRDAESEARSRRPPARRGEVGLELAPLKQWSAALVQLYLLREGVGLNPLYLSGFYRLGCYLCPALRGWELYVMLNDSRILERLKGAPFLAEFLRSKGLQPPA